MGVDVLVEKGVCCAGTGAPGAVRDVGIVDGRVAVVSESALDPKGAAKVIDASGQWVMPGFVDIHTHYDAEVIAAPSLSESVRHGVTTVTLGSCSISAVLSDPEDCSDLFTRVESVPREQVLPLLRKSKSWGTPRAFVDFLGRRPLGPNEADFPGHSGPATQGERRC